jgi:hypothetical protein
MGSLAEEIHRITSMLEEALSEGDWEIVQEELKSLEIVHHELDRQENGFEHDYE